MATNRICDVCGSNLDVCIRNLGDEVYDLCLKCHHSVLSKTIHNLTTHNFVESTKVDQLKNKFVQDELKKRGL